MTTLSLCSTDFLSIALITSVFFSKNFRQMIDKSIKLFCHTDPFHATKGLFLLYHTECPTVLLSSPWSDFNFNIRFSFLKYFFDFNSTDYKFLSVPKIRFLGNLSANLYLCTSTLYKWYNIILPSFTWT